ncbi:MAG: hypothetical protein K2M31_09785 [Muribaculaceae bacterium]|nr:hypothetical protein [Muribaculaceae bacterium]
MSHHFDCYVDTTEMAREVGSVKEHVEATTTAVVGMQAAVIDAQKTGADHVCARVNQGFYAMIHSQISQKMATLQSKVDAQLMRLNQQKKQLLAIRSRMERDYQMISARYLKIFNGLNRNLSQRVTELDRPILKFASTESEKIINRSNQLVSDVPIGQSESIRTSQTVAASNLKNRAGKAIESIEKFIADSNKLNRTTDRILLNRNIERPEELMMIPVCVSECNYTSDGSMQTQINISELNISREARQIIENGLAAMNRNGEFQWSAPQPLKPEVSDYFRRMVATTSMNPRLQQMMIALADRHPVETFL